MPDLTAAQVALIAAKSRANRPTIYDSSLQCRLPISKDTEDALILLPSEAKAKAGRYLNAFAGKEDRSSRVSDVQSAFADQQASNLAAAKAEIDLAFTQFNSFKNSLFGSGNEVFARGLDPLLKTLNLGLGRLKKKQDRIKYEVLNNRAAASVVKPNLTQDQKKELLSWVAALVAYP